jgi:hypothetical protein
VETIASSGHCLFLKFQPFVAFEIIQNKKRLRISYG